MANTSNKLEKLHERSDQTRIIQIGERVFELPLKCLGAPLSKGREQRDGIVLSVILPDFESKHELKTAEEYDEIRKEQRISGMHIEDALTRQSISLMIDNLRSSVEKYEFAGTFNDLEMEKWCRRRKEKMVFYYEIYIEKTVMEISRVSYAARQKNEIPLSNFPAAPISSLIKGFYTAFFITKKITFQIGRCDERQPLNFLEVLRLSITKISKQGGQDAYFNSTGNGQPSTILK